MSDQYNYDSYPPTPVTTPLSPGVTANTTSTGTTNGTAGSTANTTANATKHVAETVSEQATNVAAEARAQAKDLYAQTKSELGEQAALQQTRVAHGLHSMSDELSTMARNSTEGGVATDLVGQASQRIESIASWLENRDPGSLVNELKSYAGRKPGTFIAVAAAAGILAGRLTRSVTSSASEKSAEHAGPSTVPSASNISTAPSVSTTPFVEENTLLATDDGYELRTLDTSPRHSEPEL